MFRRIPSIQPSYDVSQPSHRCISDSFADVVDLYSTEEPQKAFHKRIAFCLDVHNEAVKSMRYPPDAVTHPLVHSLSILFGSFL